MGQVYECLLSSLFKYYLFMLLSLQFKAAHEIHQEAFFPRYWHRASCAHGHLPAPPRV